ncbi:hypothetical protein [Streptomyces sp. NPDC088785]|uniref:hypothetical protein n=1 Tax=Streptomyces sp. NPDC088785 TaxID=3365897 RepID=UPI00382BDB71
MYRSPDLVAHRIRRDRGADPGRTVSELAQRHRVSRKVVLEALGLEPEAPPAPAPPARPRLLDPVRDLIDDLLRRELEEAGQPRLTNTRIHEHLAQEAGFTAASVSTVRDYVRRRRPEIRSERAPS